MNYLLVFLGGGIGAALRHGVNALALRTVGIAFPFGTLTINVLGSLVMGVLAGYLSMRGNLSMETRLFLLTGVLGGFTTFSAFTLETALLVERGEVGLAALYVVLSVLLGVGALFAGMGVVRALA